MTRAELVELLQVERHLPLPPVPKASMPVDTAKEQRSRRVALEAEVEEFDGYDTGHGRRPPKPETPRMVKKGLIYVAEKRTAA